MKPHEQQQPFEGAPCIEGGIHKTPSEEDIKMFGKTVHVHSSLSKHNPVHTPEHHDPHTVINYALAAKQELVEPFDPGMSAMVGGETGVKQYDEAVHHLPSSAWW